MTNTQGSDYQNKRFSCNGCHLSRYINILSMGEEHNIPVLNNSDLSGAIPNRFPSVITILFIDAWVENVQVTTAYILGRYYLCLDLKAHT